MKYIAYKATKKGEGDVILTNPSNSTIKNFRNKGFKLTLIIGGKK